MSKPKISVIIPIRETKAKRRDAARLERCLASLARQESPDHEVIVADVGSEPAYKRRHEAAVKAAGRGFRYVYLKAPAGPFNISRARNLGLRAARGEYVMATDADAIFAPDFLARVVAELAPDRILHCAIRDLADLGGREPGDADLLAAVQRPPYCYGGCQVVLRSWAEEVGGWDEMFTGWGAEDSDLAERAILAGKRDVWLAGAEFYHQFHADSEKKDEYTAANRRRLRMTQTRQLPIVRNPLAWGGEATDPKADTAVAITTFLRDEDLARTVKCVRKYYPTMAIFIGDCGRPSEDKARLAVDYQCFIVPVAFDAGVAAARNAAIAAMPERYEYVFVMEDDIALGPDSNLGLLRRVLNGNPAVVAAGGLLRRIAVGSGDARDQHYEAEIEIDRPGRAFVIREIAAPRWREAGGVRYHLADLVLNVFLVRRWATEKVKWDEKIKTAPEHCDWFLELKTRLEGSAKVAYVPAFVAEHIKDPFLDATGEYERYRRRNDGFRVFADKWDVDWMRSSWNERFGFPDPLDLRQFATAPASAIRENLAAAAEILSGTAGLRWWIDAGTCLGAVREGDFIAGDPDIDLGIAAETIADWTAISAQFLARGFEIRRDWVFEGRLVEVSFERADVKLDVFFYFLEEGGRRRWHGAFGLGASPNEYDDFLPHAFSASLFEELGRARIGTAEYPTPAPVEQYLEERYGAGWRVPDPSYIYWRDCRAIDRNLFKTAPSVYIGGVWDLLHAGHLRILERSRALGRLIVGVLSDEAAAKYKVKPVVPLDQRLDLVRALRVVDEAIVQSDRDPTADLIAARLKPDYIVHGDDWPEVPGAAYVQSYGGKPMFFPYTKLVSSTLLRREISSRARPADPEVRARLAIGIKTFMRDPFLARTVRAIRERCPIPYRIYVADDGPVGESKAQLYRELEAEGHVVLRLPFDSGISVGRNAIVEAVREDLLLLTDDDIALNGPDDYRALVEAIERRPELGLVAAVIHNDNGEFYSGSEAYARGVVFDRNGRLLSRRAAPQDVVPAGSVSVVYADQVPNCFLARRDLFEEVRWDPRIKVQFEHLDFFLALGATSRQRAAICREAGATHYTDAPDGRYFEFRHSYSPIYFLNKWDLSDVVNRY